MNAQIIREAMPHITWDNTFYGGLPCQLRIDGSVWTSRTPAEEREAASINNDARAICAALNKP